MLLHVQKTACVQRASTFLALHRVQTAWLGHIRRVQVAPRVPSAQQEAIQLKLALSNARNAAPARMEPARVW